MINEKDILARLQNGESVDDIAQTLIDTLSKAKDAYEKELAEKAKADEEAKAREAAKAEKIEDMADVLDAIYDFIYKWYCEDDDDVCELDKAFASFTAKDAIKMIEDAGKMAIELNDLFDILEFSFEEPLEAKQTAAKAEPSVFKLAIDNKKDADHIINSFLKSLGL